MEREALLYGYTCTELSDHLAIKTLRRKIQLTFNTDEASGSWEKKLKPSAFQAVISHRWMGTAQSAAWKEMAAQPHYDKLMERLSEQPDM